MKHLKSDNSYFEFLEKRFSGIQYIPGENLNISEVKKNIFTRCWENIEKYPTMLSLCNTLGLSRTTVYKLAKEYKLPERCIYEKN